MLPASVEPWLMVCYGLIIGASGWLTHRWLPWCSGRLRCRTERERGILAMAICAALVIVLFAGFIDFRLMPIEPMGFFMSSGCGYWWHRLLLLRKEK